MPYTWIAAAEGPPWPVPVDLLVRCDGDHGLFPPPEGRFPMAPREHCYDTAKRQGWRLGNDRALCPEHAAARP